MNMMLFPVVAGTKAVGVMLSEKSVKMPDAALKAHGGNCSDSKTGPVHCVELK